MIIWDKLTVTNSIGAATFSINTAGSLSIGSSIIAPAISADEVTTSTLNVTANANFKGATFTDRVAVPTLTASGVAVRDGRIEVAQPTTGTSAILSYDTLSVKSIRNVDYLGINNRPITNAFINTGNISSLDADSADIDTLTVNTAATLPTNTTIGGESVIPGMYLTMDVMGIDASVSGTSNWVFVYNCSPERLYICIADDPDPDLTHYTEATSVLVQNKNKIYLSPDKYCRLTDTLLSSVDQVYFSWDQPSSSMASLTKAALTTSGGLYPTNSTSASYRSEDCVLLGHAAHYDYIALPNHPVNSDDLSVYKEAIKKSQNYSTFNEIYQGINIYLGTKTN